MIRRIFRPVLVSALVMAGLVGMSSLASAQNGVCIGDVAKNTLTACENKGSGAFNVGAHGKAPTVNFHSAPPPADLKKRDQQKAPNAPTETQSRDERKSRLQARAK